jgi:L-ascorbate metabolism protein UlaG (beta-lactamase superfamily)
MKIRWLGHSAFLITADDGTRIITDPYGVYPDLQYAQIEGPAEIVVVSHKHGDHFGAKVKGNPKLVTGGGEKKEKGIEFKESKSTMIPRRGAREVGTLRFVSQ